MTRSNTFKGLSAAVVAVALLISHDGNKRSEARKAEPWSDQHRARPRRVGRRVKLVEGDSTSPGERVLTSLQFRHHLHRWPTTSTP